jgi:23S rRNA (guanosine2251-2'-O)-methyltransferase
MVKRKPPPPRPRGGASQSGGGRRRRPRRAPAGAASASAGAPPDGPLWLYGVHAVLAARANPARHLHRLLATAEAARRHAAALDAGPAGPAPEIVARADIEAVLPQGAVHQGLAALATPLPAPDLDAVLARCRAAGSEAPPGPRPVLVALDQVTDPQNVGAVLRSAAAFGAAAVIVPRHHAAPESGALAKAASGALEHIPLVAVGNLTRALGRLKAAGFWTVGLAGEAAGTLAEIDPGGPLVLVLGAEGGGLRRLTRETCDLLARLPTGGPIASLNVSNAAAVALYEVLGRRA